MPYNLENSVGGKLGNIKERRNAVAHGRETPSEAGMRFNNDNLENLLNVAHNEADNFLIACQDYCTKEMFIITNNAHAQGIRP